jgi:hypothetical protein
MIDAHFNVVWETSKNVLDHFDRIDSEKVWFKFDHDVSWGMSIKDGISDP